MGKRSRLEMGTFASAACGRYSEQKGVAAAPMAGMKTWNARHRQCGNREGSIDE